ncbi:MAG: hypothetical protein NCW75_04715 [Phycisphaera sp.]|nr:MAG: hypothetical protein NCW75_04715 [Phycisphaera sp.]
MIVLFWILGIVGGLLVLVYAVLVWMTIKVSRLEPSSAISLLDDEASDELVEKMPSISDYAGARGLPLVIAIQAKAPGFEVREATWEIAPDHSYFSATERPSGTPRANFTTALRARATGERVFILTSNNGDLANGYPALGVFTEVFRTESLAELERWHEHAVGYMQREGYCEPLVIRRPLLDVAIEQAELQVNEIKGKPLKILVFPIRYFVGMSTKFGRTIEQRYPVRNKHMRRLRGEIMHSPRGYA